MVIFILDLKISYHLVQYIIINHLFFLCQLPRVDVLVCLLSYSLRTQHYVYIPNTSFKYIYTSQRKCGRATSPSIANIDDEKLTQ